jgi:hypothetical protein
VSDGRARSVLTVAGAVLAALVLLNLLADGLDRAVGGGEPRGAPGSSYATAPPGLGAYAVLLGRYGFDVRQQRGDLAAARLGADQTIVVAEPAPLTPADAAALLDFTTRGGRLVIGGTTPAYLRLLRDTPPRWSALPVPRWTQVAPDLAPVATVETTGSGAWRDAGNGRVLVGDDGAALVVHERVGRGEMLFLANTSPLSNELLDRADNAALAVALAGTPGAKVTFAEGVHGYGAETGLAALPARWKVALTLVGLAAAVFVWSRGRRFGPPDRPARELPPSRAEYVRALGTTLARTRDPRGALAPLREWARDRVAAYGALPPGATGDDFARAARALGCTDDEIDALVRPAEGAEGTLALARAVGRLAERDGRHT